MEHLFLLSFSNIPHVPPAKFTGPILPSLSPSLPRSKFGNPF